MKSKHIIIALIENLLLDENMILQFFDWTITNNSKIISENIPDIDAFEVLAGRINYNKIRSQTIAYKIVETEDEKLAKILLHQESLNINGLLSLTWLLWDNSIFSPIQFMQNFDNYNVHVYVNIKNTFISNSFGAYSTLSVSIEMVQKFFCFQLYKERDELLLSTGNRDYDLSSNILRAETEDFFSALNRLQRAFLLLYMARATSFLPMKIAFYINVLECLLLSSESELSFRLQIYAANFIGKSKNEKEGIKNTIKSAYDIRSKFFHGSNLKQKLEELQDVSIKLDSILRMSILKSMEIKDIINAKNNKVLDEYFTSTIFSQ